jgi:hypothetical protein
MLLGIIVGGAHLSFCLLFFAFYFASADPQKSMAFSLFVPFDPWIVPLSRLPITEVGFAAAVTILGTAQWWAVGHLVGTGFRWIIERLRRS